MARDFVRVSSVAGDLLNVDSNLNVGGYPFFFACRVNVDNVTVQQVLMSLADSASAAIYFQVAFRGDQSDQFQLSRRNTTAIDTNGPVSGVTAGSWHHVLAACTASNACSVYTDSSTSPGTSTTNVAFPATLNRFRMGVSARSTGDNWFDGRIAEAVVGIAIPTTGEVDAYMRGWSPDAIWPKSKIAEYYRLLGNDSPEKGHFTANALAVTTPTKAAHPPGLAWRGRAMVSFGGVVNTGISPPQGNLALSMTTPAVLEGVHPNINVPQGNIALSMTAPTVSMGTTVNLSPAAANLAFDLPAPALEVTTDPGTPEVVEDLNALVGELRLQDKEDIWRKNLIDLLEAVVDQFTSGEVSGSFFLLETGDKLELEGGTDDLLLD